MHHRSGHDQYPGLAANDFSDSIRFRFRASTAEEDEKRILNKLHFDIDFTAST